MAQGYAFGRPGSAAEPGRGAASASSSTPRPRSSAGELLPDEPETAVVPAAAQRIARRRSCAGDRHRRHRRVRDAPATLVRRARPTSPTTRTRPRLAARAGRVSGARTARRTCADGDDAPHAHRRRRHPHASPPRTRRPRCCRSPSPIRSSEQLTVLSGGAPGRARGDRRSTAPACTGCELRRGRHDDHLLRVGRRPAAPRAGDARRSGPTALRPSRYCPSDQLEGFASTRVRPHPPRAPSSCPPSPTGCTAG